MNIIEKFIDRKLRRLAWKIYTRDESCKENELSKEEIEKIKYENLILKAEIEAIKEFIAQNFEDYEILLDSDFGHESIQEEHEPAKNLVLNKNNGDIE
jgi:hypothetical protein